MEHEVAQPHPSPSGFDRRRFLGALGSGLALGSSGLPGVGEALAQSFVLREENFGRIFPELPAFFGDRPPRGLNTVLLEIGKRGGVMDAGDRPSGGSSGFGQTAGGGQLV